MSRYIEMFRTEEAANTPPTVTGKARVARNAEKYGFQVLDGSEIEGLDGLDILRAAAAKGMEDGKVGPCFFRFNDTPDVEPVKRSDVTLDFCDGTSIELTPNTSGDDDCPF
jgi:hypothetical protein